MDHELTQTEESILAQMEAMGKWDTLTHELSLFVPCSITIILSACHNSVPGIWAGLVTYGGFRLWIATKQCATVPTLKSAIRKLRTQCQQVDGEGLGGADAPPRPSSSCYRTDESPQGMAGL